MSAAWFLLAAQAGRSLLQAQETSRAAAQEAGAGAFQARYQGLMERYQIQRQAEVDARTRQDQFAQAMGAQRAMMGQAGIMGGRTARLLEARNRTQYSRAQLEEDVSAQLSTSASEFREQQRISGLRRGARAAQQQAGIDLLGDFIGFGQKGLDIYEAQRAGR
jgi:hypothetical protein